jgi:hypothetical protein
MKEWRRLEALVRSAKEPLKFQVRRTIEHRMMPGIVYENILALLIIRY